MQSKRCPKCGRPRTFTLFDMAKFWICGECSWMEDLDGNALGYQQEVKEREERERQKAAGAEDAA